jgi:hypothetical protein
MIQTYDPDIHGANAVLLQGIYWALTTVTTVGYGDLVPRVTVIETVYCSFIFFLGTLFYIATVANLMALFKRTEISSENLEFRLDACNAVHSIIVSFILTL